MIVILSFFSAQMGFSIKAEERVAVIMTPYYSSSYKFSLKELSKKLKGLSVSKLKIIARTRAIGNELDIFLKDEFRELSELSIFTTCEQLGGQEWLSLRNLKKLRFLSLGVIVTEEDWHVLPSMTSLEELEIPALGVDIDLEKLQLKKKFPNLKKLGIDSEWVKGKDIKSFGVKYGIHIYELNTGNIFKSMDLEGKKTKDGILITKLRAPLTISPKKD